MLGAMVPELRAHKRGKMGEWLYGQLSGQKSGRAVQAHRKWLNLCD